MTYIRLRALAPQLPASFVHTATVRLIEDAFARSVGGNPIEPVAIVGAPGVGKTTALARIASTRPAVAFVTVTPSNRRLKALLSMLIDVFGIPSDSRYTSGLASILEYNLRGFAEAGWSLIVDEVQLLDADAVFQLCKYTELFGLPLILAGNSHSLRRTRANASAIEQVRSRVSTWLVIDGVSEADITEFGVNANVEGKDAYGLLTHYGLKASLREVVRLLAEARIFAGSKGPIRRPALVDALASLLGPQKASALLADHQA